jgi:hypothetical protein
MYRESPVHTPPPWVLNAICGHEARMSDEETQVSTSPTIHLHVFVALNTAFWYFAGVITSLGLAIQESSDFRAPKFEAVQS